MADGDIILETPDVCKVQPITAFMSTNLNNKIKSFDDLATRILNFLGYPAVGVTELHRDMIYEAISTACEFYTRFGGYEKKCLVFDSNLYDRNKGLSIDALCTIASLKYIHNEDGSEVAIQRGPDHNLPVPSDVYVTKVDIPLADYYVEDAVLKMMQGKVEPSKYSEQCYLNDTTHRFPDGIKQFSIIDERLYKYFLTVKKPTGELKYSKDNFVKSKDKVVTASGEKVELYTEDETLGRTRKDMEYAYTFDYDLMDYRRVRSVVEFTEGSSTTMSSLFSFEAALATQAYDTYQFSVRGFDMTSWYAMQTWRDTREKMLSSKRDIEFDKDSQVLTLSPPPREGQRFFGVLFVYLEKPLRVVVRQPWVFKYALAICKQMVGRVRSKHGTSASNLMNGYIASGNNLVQEGLNEQEKLEKLLMEQNGYGDCRPAALVIG